MRALSNLRRKIDSKLWEGIDNINDQLLTFFLIFKKK